MLGLIGLMATGCAARQSAAEGPQFPSRTDLNEIMRRPRSGAPREHQKTVAVEEWQPLAAEQQPSSDAEALLKRVADAKRQDLAISPQLSCAAREAAGFFAQHRAWPDQQLEAHIAGVCGATQLGLGLAVWAAPLEAIADAAGRSDWYTAIAQQLSESLPLEANVGGAAEIADSTHGVFVTALAIEQITWEKVSTVADAEGRVELAGSVRMPAAFVHGLSNVGAYSVKGCESDLQVAAPRFRMTCQLDANDSSAWVSLQVLPPGRVLEHAAARLLLRREGTPLTFTAATKNLAPETVTDPRVFTERLIALVNKTRVAARLPTLRLEQRQSVTSAQLAPHYFQSESPVDGTADKIALGVMAGWDVPGTIRSGNLFTGSLTGSRDPRRWLSYTLQQPIARAVLLDPEASSIAIGPVVEQRSDSVAAIVSTYRLHKSDDHRADVEHFVQRLNKARSDLGLPPVAVLSAPGVSQAAASVKSSHDPKDALQDAMETVARGGEPGVQGFYVEVTDVEHIVFPPALLQPVVTLAVSAAHHRYPEAAWGTLTLLVVLVNSPEVTVAGSVPSRG
jgi:hypothetical protein